jgi:hypothetical protein
MGLNFKILLLLLLVQIIQISKKQSLVAQLVRVLH